MTWEELREYCNGKKFKNDEGIEMVFKYDGSRYPYIYISGEPTAKGKRHPAYIKRKREMHDDWSTDLYNSEGGEIKAMAKIVGGMKKLEAMLKE